MNISIVPLVIGTLALAGASHAAAQSNPSDQSVWSGWPPPAIRQPKEAVTSKRRTTRSEFGNKSWTISTRKVQAKTTEAQTTASKDLDDAWTQTKMASSRLETAGNADWNSAKISFRSESDKLAVAWHTVNPADK
jgi:hypothetical protein